MDWGTLDDLWSDDPVRQSAGCEHVRQQGCVDADRARVNARLLELFASTVNWDCSNYVAVYAVEAAASLGTPGWFERAMDAWLAAQTGPAPDADLARTLLEEIMPNADTRTLIEAVRARLLARRDMWAEPLVDLAGGDGPHADRLAEALLAYPDPQVQRFCTLELLRDLDLCRTARADEGNVSTDYWDTQIERLGRLTRDAPEDLRTEALRLNRERRASTESDLWHL